MIEGEHDPRNDPSVHELWVDFLGRMGMPHIRFSDQIAEHGLASISNRLLLNLVLEKIRNLDD